MDGIQIGSGKLAGVLAKLGAKKIPTFAPLLETPQGAVESAAHFFAVKCLAAADADDIATVRRIINGGDKGLPEVSNLFIKAKAALGAA